MKHWYHSKTIWFNLLTIFVGVAAILTGGDFGADVARWAALVVGVGNLVLRVVFTDTGIAK